ncbi:hypothetical protein F4808DRAFT_436901 [Astrocystis sublimbata]|nr:hypothetical protein F4808DRAFT_436901 [Astrocystis sublimbata]
MGYINPQSMMAIGLLFPILALVSIGVRMYGWRYYRRSIDIDDILIIPAGFLTIAAGAALVTGTQLHIIGGHSLPTNVDIESVKLGKFEYAFWIGHVLAIGFIKLTILFLFRRLFKGSAIRTTFDHVNWVLIALVTLWTAVFLFFDIFACGTAPEASWESWNSLRSACVDTFGMQTGCAVFSWVLDLAIFTEPLVMIRTLNMSRKRKIQTSFIFMVSGFAVIAGLIRLIPWIQVLTQGITNPTIRVLGTTFPIGDQQGIISIVIFWTYIEIGVGFQVACVPRSAWVLDKISVNPPLSKLRSLPSSVSLLKKARNFRRRGGDTSRSESSWQPTSQPKDSLGQLSNDKVDLVKCESI